MTGALYAQFLRENAIPAVKRVVGNLHNVIWQDDQDSKHRMRVPMDVISEFFDERIESEDGDAKFADVWTIENVWGILREKVRGQEFPNNDALIRRINKV